MVCPQDVEWAVQDLGEDINSVTTFLWVLFLDVSDTSRTCFGHVSDTSRKRLGNVSDTSRVWDGSRVSDTSRTRLRHVSDTSGTRSYHNEHKHYSNASC